jgi:hypothetical protein
VGERHDTDLEDALASCRQVLADYQAGVLDDEQARRALVDAGIAFGPNPDQLPLTSAVVGHLRQFIDALEDAKRTEGWG